jgi:hypothetical protein
VTSVTPAAGGRGECGAAAFWPCFAPWRLLRAIVFYVRSADTPGLTQSPQSFAPCAAEREPGPVAQEDVEIAMRGRMKFDDAIYLHDD